MFHEAHITPILSVSNVTASERFFCDKLGLRQSQRLGDGGVVLAGASGELLMLSPHPDVHPTGNTVASFEVADLEDAVHELEGRGVHFEDYDLPGLRTERHIAQLGAERAAWFKDPDGNVLCVHEGARAA